jgi:hypothetical protein
MARVELMSARRFAMTATMTIQQLRDDLALRKPAKWAVEGIRALEQPDMAYEGGSGSVAGTRACELLRIYDIRLAHLRARSINAEGMAELVDWLRSLPPETRVSGEVFLSSTTAVTAFYSPPGVLGACVTIAYDPARGYANWAFAMGH